MARHDAHDKISVKCLVPDMSEILPEIRLYSSTLVGLNGTAPHAMPVGQRHVESLK
ncbi:cytochrome P450 family protein [Aspergillus luchuensis]|uniref:Cytochrome P450 family protein n=1 Tax=Aspergillus kawachii TaxID=1069201 RepID=A0A146F7S1_ASPKA|nr:cytochrome P450 family protein [Aspergillus luchuensis]